MATFEGPVPAPVPQTQPLTILITGASRGLGLELVKQYSEAYQDNIIIAAVRDPSGPTSSSLMDYSQQHKNVHIIPLDVSNEASIHSSVDHLPSSVDHIDLLYNNAGIFGQTGDVTHITGAGLLEVLNTNVVGPLLVTQTYLPLLTQAKEPKVIITSSSMGASSYTEPIVSMGAIPYSLSKAAATWINNALHYALPKVTFLAIHPGWVETDMGTGDGHHTAPIHLKDSIQATRAWVQQKSLENSGQFFSVVTGDLIPY